LHGRLNRVVARCPECDWNTTVFRDPLGRQSIEQMEDEARDNLADHREDEHGR